MDLDGDNSDLDEFIVDDDEVNASSGARKGKSSADTRRKKHALQGNAEDGAEYAWEGAFQRSWDVVQEDASGSLAGVVNEFVEKSKRRRLLRDTDTIQRGLIRHIYLVLDLSLAMTDRDLRPSRLELTLQYAQEFINEFFDQNPISQLGIIGMKDGIAERVSPLSGEFISPLSSAALIRRQATLWITSKRYQTSESWNPLANPVCKTRSKWPDPVLRMPIIPLIKLGLR